MPTSPPSDGRLTTSDLENGDHSDIRSWSVRTSQTRSGGAEVKALADARVTGAGFGAKPSSSRLNGLTFSLRPARLW